MLTFNIAILRLDRCDKYAIRCAIFCCFVNLYMVMRLLVLFCVFIAFLLHFRIIYDHFQNYEYHSSCIDCSWSVSQALILYVIFTPFLN